MALDSTLEPITEVGTQQFCVEMMKRLNIQRKNQQFDDVILQVGSGDHQARLKAHRNVLSAASPFFSNALNSEMKEKEEGVIRLEETSKDIMEGVLEFMYTGYVDISEENVYELFTKGDYFILPSLKSFSTNFILKTLSPSNCIKAYYFAMKYDWEELRKGSRDFIQENFAAVAESDDFLNLNSEQVEEWISSDEIIVDAEEKVFEVVLKWVERDESRKQENLMDLFRHIRFVYVPRDYLFKVILPHPLVRENYGFCASVFSVMKSAFDGTEECFFMQPPRSCLKTHEDVIVACGENKVLCYVPSSKEWRELADNCKNNKHVRIFDFHAASACHGKLYVIGFQKNETTDSYGRRSLGTDTYVVKRYEPSLNLWTCVKDLEIASLSPAAFTLQGFLYVLGGKNHQSYRLHNTVQKYNPDRDEWQVVSPLSSPRSGVCAVADGSYLYAIGGSDATDQYLDIVERYDPRNNTWDKLPSMLTRRSDAGGAAIKEKVFVFGGRQAEGTDDGTSCEMYDPATRVWSGIQSQLAPKITSAVSLNRQIYVFGAFREPGGQEMSLQVYDVDQNQWEPSTDVSFDSGNFFRISRLRILKSVLEKFSVASYL